MADDDSYFSDADWDTIRKYLIGGASGGLGIGLLTSYFNYLSQLDKKKDEEDDDTLYVYKKEASASDEDETESSYWTTPTAMVGGGLAAIGSYLLVRKIYTALKLKKAQEELDEAQHAFLNASGYETAEQEKSAASGTRPISFGETLISAPVLVPALTATGAAILAYKLLDKEFPIAIKKPKRPKRIEVIEKPDEDQEEYEKQASASDMLSDGIEYLMRMTLLTKSATSDLANLVAAAATGELPAFEKAAKEIGFINALDTVKGAASRAVDPLNEHLAICTLAKKASLKHQVGVLAAIEFAENQSSTYKAAATLDEDTKDTLCKASCCLGRAIRYELSEELGIKPPTSDNLEKQATSVIPGIDEYLLDAAMSELLNRATHHGSDEDSEEDDESNEVEDDSSDDSTDTSGEEADIENPNSPSRRKKKDKVKFISSAKSRRGFLSKLDPDVVDKILTP